MFLPSVEYTLPCLCSPSVLWHINIQRTDVYEERHALDALHDNTEAVHTTPAHTGALYNPSIPIDPPKASFSKAL